MSIKFGSLEVADIKFGSIDVNYVYSGSNLVWQRSTPPTEDLFYLTSDVNFYAMYTLSGSLTVSIDYRIGETGSWTSWDGSQVSVSGGTKLYVRNNNTTLSTSNSNNFKFSGNFKTVGGNLKYMLGESDTLSNYCFYYLFNNITSLQNASELILPWMTLTNYCYAYMFYNCTSLTQLPALPATTLAIACYQGMFSGCTSLVSYQALPATTLATSCYSYMFNRCISLETCPTLPATTLATYCYNNMFNGCTSLTSCPTLPATTLANYCYQDMFQGCRSLTQLPALPAIELKNACYYYMFSGCSNIKLSTTQEGEYVNAYRIPTTGEGTTATSALQHMFLNTGGTFTGAPTINTTYYTSNEIIS